VTLSLKSRSWLLVPPMLAEKSRFVNPVRLPPFRLSPTPWKMLLVPKSVALPRVPLGFFEFATRLNVALLSTWACPGVFCFVIL